MTRRCATSVICGRAAAPMRRAHIARAALWVEALPAFVRPFPGQAVPHAVVARVPCESKVQRGGGRVERSRRAQEGCTDVIFDSKSTSSFTHQTVTPHARMFKRAHICIITSHNKQEARTASIHPHLNTSVCCFNRPCGLASHHTSAATHHCPTPGRRLRT